MKETCYRNYLGPLVLMITGLVMAILLSQAHGEPPPSNYARVALPDAGVDEARPQPDAAQAAPAPDEPENGLGTSPSIADIGTALGALFALVNIVVGLTPTKRDDEFLGKVYAFAERWAFVLPGGLRNTFKLPGTRPPGGAA